MQYNYDDSQGVLSYLLILSVADIRKLIWFMCELLSVFLSVLYVSVVLLRYIFFTTVLFSLAFNKLILINR